MISTFCACSKSGVASPNARAAAALASHATRTRALHHGGQRLAGRLIRAGVAAEFKRLPSDEDPANALLSYAADSGADLMVAGGYGHSRIREALFGGVTRTLLSSQTLPLFLSR